MAKKIYIMENLGCANCAAKMENQFNALPEVEEAVITFATRQLYLTAADPDSLVEKLTRIAQTVEANVYIRPREDHHHHHDCGCDHHYGHDHECGCGHHHDEPHHGTSHEHTHEHHHGGDDKKTLLLGAALFIAGLIFSLINIKFLPAVVFVGAYVILNFKLSLDTSESAHYTTHRVRFYVLAAVGVRRFGRSAVVRRL